MTQSEYRAVRETSYGAHETSHVCKDRQTAERVLAGMLGSAGLCVGWVERRTVHEWGRVGA